MGAGLGVAEAAVPFVGTLQCRGNKAQNSACRFTATVLELPCIGSSLPACDTFLRMERDAQYEQKADLQIAECRLMFF